MTVHDQHRCPRPAALLIAAGQASRAAGIPDAAGATTSNKVCGSGMKPIMFGHDLIKAGSANVVVAGGMESMTNAPHLLNGSRTGIKYVSTEMLNHMASEGLTNPDDRSEEHTSVLPSLMSISSAAFCLTNTTTANQAQHTT